SRRRRLDRRAQHRFPGRDRQVQIYIAVFDTIKGMRLKRHFQVQITRAAAPRRTLPCETDMLPLPDAFWNLDIECAFTGVEPPVLIQLRRGQRDGPVRAPICVLDPDQDPGEMILSARPERLLLPMYTTRATPEQ